MHYIKYLRFPNNEIRAIHYSRPGGRVPARPVLLWAQFVIILCACLDSVPFLGFSCPLDISSDFGQAVKMKLPHKRTRFGSDAKNTLLRAGGALDTLCSDPSKYVFLTGTLPGSTSAAYTAMAIYSSSIVDALRHWLKRTCPSEYWMYVWELQKRGALHIHYCCYVPDGTVRQKLIQSFPAKWRDILDSVGERASVDMWQRSDGTTHAYNKEVLQAYAQEVRKSVAAYLAGYCGGSKDKHGMDETSPYYPVRWWGYSRKLSALLKGLTEEVVVPHTNYRDARSELQLHKETVAHATEHCHSYPHKVGSGATVISYHPEDKGKSIWQQVTKMQYPPATFPNTSSMIAMLREMMLIYPPYLKAAKNSKRPSLPRVLRDCEDSAWLGSLSRYTVNVWHLRLMDALVSELSLNYMAERIPEKTANILIPCVWAWNQNKPFLRYQSQGWLSLESDLPILLTDCWSLR